MRTITLYVAKVRRETDLAFLFVLQPEDGDGELGRVGDSGSVLNEGEKLWIPKSVIEDADDIAVGDEDLEVNVAEWFAEKEGLA